MDTNFKNLVKLLQSDDSQICKDLARNLENGYVDFSNLSNAMRDVSNTLICWRKFE